MKKEKIKHRFDLGFKLNIMTIIGMVVLAIVLLLVTDIFYEQKINEIYYQRANQVADSITEGFAGAVPVSAYVDMINDESFKEAKRQAIESNDDKYIIDWMKARPSIYSFEEDVDENGNEVKRNNTFYEEYMSFSNYLKKQQEIFNLKSVYLQYVKNGVTYNLMDPTEKLTFIGSVDDPVEEFATYKDDEPIDATVYEYKGEWICTASEVISDTDINGNELVAHVCVDFDLSNVTEDRNWFLINSAVFVIVLTFVVILISLLLTRKFATKPLKQLSQGATGFAKNEDEGFSMEDVINLPIKSNDEIGDLYNEIRSMQRRIIEGTNKLTKITAERERVNTELDMAKRIQASMLPNIFPAFPDREEFDLYASMSPAKEVGGDFYDFFMIDDDNLFILIADVSDKGIPAALFMMSTKILINYRAKNGGSPGEILTDVNNQISIDNDEMMFVTVWMGILNLRTGNLKCTNAGHEYPFIRTKDEGFKIYEDKREKMVGVLPGTNYEDYELSLNKGDAIFVYTDGIPEAVNSSGEMYGMERLESRINDIEDQSPEGILRGIREDVDEFSKDTTQFDDLTMLCVEYKSK
ncbi:MAG: serine/threonine-protein phosphatase [Lachnospiraceae bacterium]|nr:serine/threonine-protein phosphatase [Lachnospiraceae bacterium]